MGMTKLQWAHYRRCLWQYSATRSACHEHGMTKLQWAHHRRCMQNRIAFLTNESAPRLVVPLRLIGAGDSSVMEYKDKVGEIKRILWDERHHRHLV